MRILNDLYNNSYSKLVELVVLPIGDIIFGQRMMNRLSFLRKAQWWDRDQIIAYQAKKLNDLIQTVYLEVPFYRFLIDQSPIRPSQKLSIEHLSNLPIINKQMLRSVDISKITRSTKQHTYEAFTSGSTGENFRVIEDSATAGFYRATFLLSLEWAGWKIGDPHIQTGMTLNRSMDRLIKDYILRCHYVSAYNLSDTKLDEIMKLMEKYNIKHLWGYPGSIYYLACRAEKEGWNVPLKSIVTWGDTLIKNWRSKIEKIFNAPVFDTYGCGEGFHIAAQCGNGNHYHRHSLDAIIEIVNEQGQPVSQGERGQVVVTRLYPGPMPFIRYAVGDYATEAKNNICECGRNLEELESIDGRIADTVITPNGNRLIVHFFTGILENFPEIEAFQVVQESLDSITLLIVPAQIFTKANEDLIIRALNEKCADLKIKIELVNNIPLQATGKRKFIISNI